MIAERRVSATVGVAMDVLTSFFRVVAFPLLDDGDIRHQEAEEQRKREDAVLSIFNSSFIAG